MEQTSSTQEIPTHGDVPQHVAIIMDGNGRWAKQRRLPRLAGHRRGVEAVRNAVKACGERGIPFLTLFAFSSENWRRPPEEVAFLMQLFSTALTNEVEKLRRRGARLRVVGDLTRFDARLRDMIAEAERRTAENTTLTLTVAVNYGGRWDILQALSALLRAHPELAHEGVTEAQLAPYLCMSYAPEPDLFIRTGGECRISNFLLWQLAYTELYFTDVLWPDFDGGTLDQAIASYRQRERRFGRTSDQVEAAKRAQRAALADGSTTANVVA